jgi:hypothetical protein
MTALVQNPLRQHLQKTARTMDKRAEDALVVVTLGTITLIACLSLLSTL